ncbi:uncharacterized protein [Epargyreus clarus]|uniref:uncharacterized protein n=1 Tax=Epargyreus clarus TaxID=520877 RepID=UPI003C2AB3AD
MVCYDFYKVIEIGKRAYLTGSNAYVLLQVRKGDNQSNVDALIHKVVPDNYDIDTARKQFDSKAYRAKKYKDDKLESIVIAIDSGASPDDSYQKSALVDRIFRRVSNLFHVGAMNALPKYRAKLEQYHIKPEIVHFKSGKPSVMFEINTKAMMNSVKDFLASKDVKKYADKFANKAAVIYRTVKEELLND